MTVNYADGKYEMRRHESAVSCPRTTLSMLQMGIANGAPELFGIKDEGKKVFRQRSRTADCIGNTAFRLTQKESAQS